MEDEKYQMLNTLNSSPSAIVPSEHNEEDYNVNTISGTTYSLENKNKVRIFKSYARMMTDEGKLTRLAVTTEGAAEDSPLALVIIAPLDTVQYFLLDHDPNKQISDLFVNIGIDLFNNIVAGILTTIIVIALFGATSAGFIVLAGSEYAADLSYAEELKDKAYNWPFIDILLVDSIDYIQYRLAHESPEWLAKKLVDDTFATAAISILTLFIMTVLRGEKLADWLGSKLGDVLFAKWFARSLIMGGISTGLKGIASDFQIDQSLKKSSVAQKLYTKTLNMSEAIQQSDMVQILAILIQKVSNPAKINSAIQNTDWSNNMVHDYLNTASNPSSIPTWTNPGEGGI